MSHEIPGDIGTVTQVKGKSITVEINKSGGCKNCGMKGLCGTGNNPIVLHFETDGSYQTGDKVLVSVTTGIKLLSSLIVFLIPLLALFGGFYIARFYSSELTSILAGFAALVLSFLIVRLLDKRIGKHINFELGGKYEDLPE